MSSSPTDDLQTLLDESIKPSPAQPAAAPAALIDSSGHLLQPGEVLGGVYRVTGFIGAGGMSQVHEAYDPLLDRMVAIKMTKPFIRHDTLHAEARALASLRHPGLVTVYGLGQHKGRTYIVLERLYGLTLKDHMAKRTSTRFTIDETLDILVSLADVLAYIHRNGIVHRDIKPANIMLENQNRLVLMDFGLFFSTSTPADGNRSGSPHYIAPETITGRMKADQGPLVDIYAMGVLAFELLTGSPPFEGAHLAEILDKHLEALPPDVRGQRSDISVHLARLIHEMLAKDPAKRPGSVNVIAMWLRALQRGRALPGTRQTMSVLIVDDDPDMLGLLSTCVDHALPGVRVRTAVNGLDALHEFRSDPPDLLLVDLEMPTMSGIELCMYLRGTTLAERTSIVAVSAHDSKHERQLLSQLGVAHFISKRMSSDQLINELIDLVRQIRDHRSQMVSTQPIAASELSSSLASTP